MGKCALPLVMKSQRIWPMCYVAPSRQFRQPNSIGVEDKDPLMITTPDYPRKRPMCHVAPSRKFRQPNSIGVEDKDPRIVNEVVGTGATSGQKTYLTKIAVSPARTPQVPNRRLLGSRNG